MSLKKILSISALLLFSNAAVSNEFSSQPHYGIDQSMIETSPIGFNEEDVNCLAKNIYHESGNEGEEGKIAVGMVTINRAKHDDWPDTVCGVVKERAPVARTGKIVCQFSWYCTKKRATSATGEQWIDSKRVAVYLLSGGYYKYLNKFGNLLYFHSASVSPGWRLKRLARVGGNIYYGNFK